VEKSDSGLQIWVFQQPPENWFKDCIAPKRNSKGISLMVWGCFWGRNHGNFCHRIVKSVNKGVYVKLLLCHLLPVLKHVHDTLRDPISQQENAPVHKASVFMDFLENWNIHVEDWQPYSPDLNCIEHVWVELRGRLHRKYPYIWNTKGGADKVKAR